MDDNCSTCNLSLPDSHLYTCDHCHKIFCTPHLIAHNRDVTMNLVTIPSLVRSKA